MLIRAPMFRGKVINGALSGLEYVTYTIKSQAIFQFTGSPKMGVTRPNNKE